MFEHSSHPPSRHEFAEPVVIIGLQAQDFSVSRPTFQTRLTYIAQHVAQSPPPEHTSPTARSIQLWRTLLPQPTFGIESKTMFFLRPHVSYSPHAHNTAYTYDTHHHHVENPKSSTENLSHSQRKSRRRRRTSQKNRLKYRPPPPPHFAPFLIALSFLAGASAFAHFGAGARSSVSPYRRFLLLVVLVVEEEEEEAVGFLAAGDFLVAAFLVVVAVAAEEEATGGGTGLWRE